MRSAIGWRGWVYAGCAWLQGPLLALLVGADWAGVGLLCLASSLAAGWVAGRVGASASPGSLRALGTLSVGSAGMLAGWWADAGFAPAIQGGACSCLCGEGAAALGASWMVVGMAAACFSCAGWRRGDPWRQVGSQLLCLVGMVAGMAAGPRLLPVGLAAWPALQLLATFATMSAGMLAGALAVGWLQARRWRGALRPAVVR